MFFITITHWDLSGNLLNNVINKLNSFIRIDVCDDSSSPFDSVRSLYNLCMTTVEPRNYLPNKITLAVRALIQIYTDKYYTRQAKYCEAKDNDVSSNETHCEV